MSSRSRRERDRARSHPDAKAEADTADLATPMASDSPQSSQKEKGKEGSKAAASHAHNGKDDADGAGNEGEKPHDEVCEFIRNSLDPKLAPLRVEYEAVLQGTHTEFLAACRKLEMGKNQRIAAAEQLRDYQIRCIQEQCEAEKKEADDLFADEQQTIRETMLQQLIDRHRHGGGSHEDLGDTRMFTRKMRRRSDGPEPKTEKMNFQQGTIRRKLNQLSMQFQLRPDETAKDLAEITKAMQAINNNSKEAKNTEPGFAAFVENSKLTFNDTVFDKGDTVLVNHQNQAPSRGVIQNINNSEVCVKCPDGSKTRVYLSHLRSGRCTIALTDSGMRARR